MRFATALFLLLLAHAQAVSAQEISYVTINDDVTAGTSMQIYFDFLPSSTVGGIPPLSPSDEDALITILPIPEDLTSNGFVTLLGNELNDYFRKRGMDHFVRLRERDGEGERAHDGSIEVNSPTALSGIFASGSHLTPPSTEVTESPGISFNPSFGNATRPLTSAFAGTPNAQLQINDLDPNTDVTHQVEVITPGPLKFSFLSGTNSFQGVTFLLSDFYNPENIPASSVFFPGSLDIGTFSNGNFQNINVIADSNFGGTGSFLDPFFRTDASGRLDFQVSVGLTAAGDSIATQAIIADPTIMPGGLSFTQAADLHFSVGKEQTFMLGDDGAATVSFISGTSFDFYGLSYTQVNISANGFVTFGTGTGIPGGSTLIDPGSALAGDAAIFANWANWDPSANGVRVRQFGAEFRIDWGSTLAPISHSGETDAGAFSLVLHLDIPPGAAPPNQREAIDGLMSVADAAGSAFIDTQLLDNGNDVSIFDSLVGISPGNILPGTTVLNRSFDAPFYPTFTARPILSQHNATGQALSSLNVGTGGPAAYNNGATVALRSVSFFPTDDMGLTSYIAIPDEHPTDDLQGAGIPALSIAANNNGPLPFNLIGYFRYLFSFDGMQPAPTFGLVDAVTLTPIAPLNFLSLMAPGGIGDAGTVVAAPSTTLPAPGFRGFEGVEVVLPAGALAGVNPGTLALIQIGLPNGKILLSRETILIN